MNYRMVLTGVGGQGIIFLVKVLAQCALNRGIDFIGTETHGMARKGGPVISYLKIGGFKAPLIGKGQADLLLGLYQTETLRFLYYLKSGGDIVTNVESEFPRIGGFKLFTVEGSSLAMKGEITPKSLNIFILGYALKSVNSFPFSKEEIERAIVELNPRFAEANVEALTKGYSA